MVEFVQAGIKVQQEKEFGELRSAIERVLAPAAAEKFLRQVKRKGMRVRQFDEMVAAGILEKLDPQFAGRSAAQMYRALTVSDQGQMREFYLTRVEQIGPQLRAKYHAQFETF